MRAGLLAVVAALGCTRPAPPAAAPAPSAAGADARAEQAALYALPVVIMDLTREQFFADPMAADATPNRFLHIPILGTPSFRSVVRPNVDTLYSTAWLDLTGEPVLLTLPPDDGLSASSSRCARTGPTTRCCRIAGRPRRWSPCPDPAMGCDRYRATRMCASFAPCSARCSRRVW